MQGLETTGRTIMDGLRGWSSTPSYSAIMGASDYLMPSMTIESLPMSGWGSRLRDSTLGQMSFEQTAWDLVTNFGLGGVTKVTSAGRGAGSWYEAGNLADDAALGGRSTARRFTPDEEAFMRMVRRDGARVSRGLPAIEAADVDAYIDLAAQLRFPVRALDCDLCGNHSHSQIPIGPDAAHVHINGIHFSVPYGYVPPEGLFVIRSGPAVSAPQLKMPEPK
jgi:hypothetical protein